MGFVLGFGQTEKDFERGLEDKIRARVVGELIPRDSLYFSDEAIEDVRKWIGVIAEESQKKADEYGEAENFPDRYSRFWASVVASASYIVFIISVHHINRRHAMSPDGWGMMKSELVFYIPHSEIREIREAA